MEVRTLTQSTLPARPASLPRHSGVQWPRFLGISFGLATQLFFALTVIFLYRFLASGKPPAAHYTPWLDVYLALQFAIPHSLLLWPRCSTYVKRWVPSAHYGCLFCLVTCLSLWAIFGAWTSTRAIVWETTGAMRWTLQGAFLASWVALFYSISLTGLGYQTGWTPWWHWATRRPLARREFAPRGAYLFFRHPVYISFLGLIWFTPRMTWDHAILTGIWTVYILLGCYLKDERLAYFYGGRYRAYQATTPAFPLTGWLSALAHHPTVRSARVASGKR